MVSLSKKQLAVIDDLFAGEDEQEVLDKNKVSRGIYYKWQNAEEFSAEFDRRLIALNRRSELIIARYAALAAAKLVELTESESQETARKACLDIISLPRDAGKKAEALAQKQKEVNEEQGQLPTETASKLLAALAETKKEAE